MTQPFTLTGTYRRDKADWFTITDAGQFQTNWNRFVITYPDALFFYPRSFNIELTSPATFECSDDDTHRQDAHDEGVAQGGDPDVGADFLLKGNYVHPAMNVSYIALGNDVFAAWARAYYAGSPTSFNPTMGTITRGWIEMLGFSNLESSSPVALVDGDDYEVILYDRTAETITPFFSAVGATTGKDTNSLTVGSLSLGVDDVFYIIIGVRDDVNYGATPTVTVDGNNAFWAGDFAGSTYADDGVAARVYYFSPRHYQKKSVSGDLVVTFGSSMMALAVTVTRVSQLGDTGGGVATGGTGTGFSDNPSRSFSAPAFDVNFCIAAVVTKGPEGDDDGTWGGGFAAGQTIGTSGGDDDDNVKISEGIKITTVAAAENPFKTGITARRWICYTYASPQNWAF